MTREEAIRLIKDHIDTYVVCHGEEDTVAVSIDNVDVEAFDMAIKALEQEPCDDATLKDIFCMGCEYKEQEPILDKIRAEIEHEYLAEGHLSDYWIGIGKCLQIIDKYKAESEERNDN